jgi:DNA modification methylase
MGNTINPDHAAAPRNVVLRGDCVEVMKTLPADSIDAIVTDPPYGIDFMGKEWDGFGTPLGFQTWTEQWAREAFRVLRPGGHLLAFGGTRMYHRLATGVEDAGFEVRDMMSWLYGSGFPKSLAVSKAMDTRRNDRAAVYAVTAFVRSARDAAGKTNRDLAAPFGFSSAMADHWVTDKAQPSCPTWSQWLELKTLLGFGDEMDATVLELNGRKGTLGKAWAEREVIATQHNWGGSSGSTPNAPNGSWNITAPATDDAKRWEGWGTALKPAQEPIVVARKPLIGTVAENVLAHGTGAINIDASRIETSDALHSGGLMGPMTGDNRTGAALGMFNGGPSTFEQHKLGRWPANVLFDEEAAAVLDKQSGRSKSTLRKRDYQANNGARFDVARDGAGAISGPTNTYNDRGGASRFFYVAKAGKKERNAGVALNNHPTVKPIALMSYLIKMVTPPGGVVLDPFLGSGSTACAAAANGFDWLGIERDEGYADIAEARIQHWSDKRSDKPLTEDKG